MTDSAPSPAPTRDASVWCPAWQDGFADLGPAFVRDVLPQPLADPYWVGTSAQAGALIGLPEGWQRSPEMLAAFTGNTLLPGSRPVATIYSGHQFGVWAGQLGDGRALLLGQTCGQELQLKGSGRTPFSRMGDGRAVLRSSIREFLCSEAMHALGIPTTRALCVTGSPALVAREELETAAVVTRLAESFIRFGHFEHFAARGHTDELRALADHVIERHYPACRANAGPQRAAYAALLEAVTERTARLLAQWQAVGFCHGVMNTDNMSILGLTLDYGPFQFLDAYDPGHICNHSDAQGRYAFDRQPTVAWWNLHRLAQALMPLIDDVQAAQSALAGYEATLNHAYLALMRAKLGLGAAVQGDDAGLLQQLLALLAADRVDYPIFWRRLSQAVATGDFGAVRDLFLDGAGIDAWLLTYQELLAQQERGFAADLMLRSNPRFVLRNHLAEQAIRAAKLGDFSEVQTLQTLLARPFDEHPGHDAHAGFPPDWAAHLSISCSS
ncbi:protein adenylyltransferase SelO [Melaminivora sp.]|uniref:protein adenylyltransferase SelO n=1 Tax=Melaminivora sp. TaxID=1933032 RepID=UPI0028B04DEB|nr:YdiU family protein [Melaminivora sp.]